MLSAQHLVKSGRQAKQNAGKQSEDFSAAAVENKIQRHKGETGCGVSGGKTASGFGLHETFRIAVDNADKRVKAVVYIELVRTVDVGKIFGAGDDQRDKDDAQQQDQHRPAPDGQRRFFQRQQQKNQATGSGCGQQKFQPFVKYGTEFLVQSRVNKPFMRFRPVKQVLQRSVGIGKLFGQKDGG